VAGVVVLAALAAGCGAVDLSAPDVSGADRRACLSLVDDLPQDLADEQRRETEGSRLGAAWGDPAIVLRCGVGTPEDYEPFSPCQRVNGVDWFVPEQQMADQDADVLLTTIGRKPAIEVRVPSEYRPPDSVMVDLAATITEHTGVVRACG
jgi:hypothetical protein